MSPLFLPLLLVLSQFPYLQSQVITCPVDDKCSDPPYPCPYRRCASFCCIEDHCYDPENPCKSSNTLIIVLAILAVLTFIAILMLNYFRKIRMQRMRSARRNLRNGGTRLNGPPAGPNDPVWQSIEYDKGIPLPEGPIKQPYEVQSVSRIEYGEIDSSDKLQIKKDVTSEEPVGSPVGLLHFDDIYLKAHDDRNIENHANANLSE